MCSQPFIGSLYSDHIEHLNSDSQPIENINNIAYVKKTYLRMPGGPQVLRKAVNAMSEAAISALSKSPWTIKDIDYLIPHQANERIIEGVAERLNFPKEKVISIIQKIGNNSSVTIPACLDMAVHGKIQGKKINRGNKILFTSVGGGYSVASIVMEY
jgi:3-oxoacyl-[acyl-carrier-protein] synthase-3